ncbi:MAG: hypothetical protein M1504_00495 [Candidatus Marsarchaeota archaeon]|nr:hypothetical protein [Candidatus Marsarchaeota archaeon]
MFIVYSLADPVSMEAGRIMRELLQPEEAKPINGLKHFVSDEFEMLELKESHIYADYLDDMISTDCIIFLSRHSSKSGIASFTVHAEGNWSSEAKLGGKPEQLSTAAPVEMLRVLSALSKNNHISEINVTYEATHHGPLLKTPSLYAELGGNETVMKNTDYVRLLVDSVLDSFEIEPNFKRVAIGIGGLHYADRFTRRALEGEYAFAHILSKHYSDNVDMIPQAIERSNKKPEVAVIEWSSLGAAQRNAIIDKLDEIGIDHVRM